MASDPTPKQTAGFTLAELLVVVGIIGVLVAIAIPLFTASLESAKEATCQANRRSMYAEVVTKAMGTSESETEVFNNLNVEGKIYTCPDNGTWTWNENSRVIKCSKHGLTMDEEMYANVLDKLAGAWGGQGDTGARNNYSTIYGISEWPPITGTNGTDDYYLQFKSWGNKSDTSFLYAGYEKQITGGGNQWNAKYICDSQGLLGTAGQWYECADKTGLANVRSEEAMKDLLGSLESGAKVNLVDGKFVKAS